MFRISRRLDYGLHLMLALAIENSDQPQSTASLSKKLQMPLPFMHQIARSLTQSGLIKATPGPRGGLILNQNPSDITVLNIVEALEGPITLSPFHQVSETEQQDATLLTQSLWSELQQKIVLSLDSITLDALLANSDQLILPVVLNESIL